MQIFGLNNKYTKMKNNFKQAFTLVELIVVITILAILATVGFISFQWYTSSSRDSVRLADLKNISKSFEINRTKDIDFPLPDKKVDISASGTIFQYQWELSQNILESDLNIFDGGFDPVTKKPYGYAVSLARNQFQIIWFLENKQNVANNILSQSFADNSDKYIKSSGDYLGIFLDEITKEIITASGTFNELDVANTASSYTYIQPGNTVAKEVTWSGYTLAWEFQELIFPRADCNALLKNGLATTSGLYDISPDNINTFQVYCDMETHWGGWTLINGSSEKIGGENYTYNDSNPNFDNYNMSWAILEKLLVNTGDKTIRHVFKRQDEDITTDITLNINPKLIQLDTDETYLCFNDKRNTYQGDNLDYLDNTISPISKATYNGWKTVYNSKINDTLRVRLHCPNYNSEWENYYSHLKVYKNWVAHHLPWDSFLSDNSSKQYSQYYIQDGYLEIPHTDLPTFWSNLQWLKYNSTGTHNFLNGLDSISENANQAVLSSPHVQNNLGFEVYMMVR